LFSSSQPVSFILGAVSRTVPVLLPDSDGYGYINVWNSLLWLWCCHVFI